MSTLISVIGSDIYFENRHVGALDTNLWATLYDSVASHMEGTDGSLMSSEDHEQELEDLKKAHDEELDELRTRLDEIKGERDEFEARCDLYEAEDGTASELADLRAANARLTEHNTALTKALHEARKPAAPKRRAPRRASV